MAIIEYNFEMTKEQRELLNEITEKVCKVKKNQAYFFVPQGVLNPGTNRVSEDILTIYLFVEDEDYISVFHIADEYIYSCVPFDVIKKKYDTKERGLYYVI